MGVLTTDRRIAEGRAPSASAAAETPIAATTSTDTGLLLLRLALGIIFIAHGAQKVLGLFGGPGLTATVTGMGHMGVPAPLAYLAAFTEFFGGIAVVLGMLTRLASLGLLITMAVATVLVHLPNGFFLSSPGAKGPGFEYNFALMGMALALLFAGPGRIAFGDWERNLLRRRV